MTLTIDPSLTKRREVWERLTKRHRAKMDADYAKAKERAARKGRTIPPQDQYYAHYGIYYGTSLKHVYRP